jgi:hypothetical protein
MALAAVRLPPLESLDGLSALQDDEACDQYRPFHRGPIATKLPPVQLGSLRKGFGKDVLAMVDGGLEAAGCYGKESSYRRRALAAAARLARRIALQAPAEQEDDHLWPAPISPPTFDPPGGRAKPGALLTMTADPGCTIEFRTDGVMPDAWGRWGGCSIENVQHCVYRSPLALSPGEFTVHAIARRSNGDASSVASAKFVVPFARPKEVVTGTINLLCHTEGLSFRLHSTMLRTQKQQFDKALESAVGHSLSVRVQGLNVHFTADVANGIVGEGIVHDLTSSTFPAKLSRSLNLEGVHVHKADLKVGKAESFEVESEVGSEVKCPVPHFQSSEWQDVLITLYECYAAGRLATFARARIDSETVLGAESAQLVERLLADCPAAVFGYLVEFL